MWQAPEKRYRLVRLKLGDTVTVARDNPVSGTLVRFEADGFWLECPDGMAYRYVLGTAEPGGTREQAEPR